MTIENYDKISIFSRAKITSVTIYGIFLRLTVRNSYLQKVQGSKQTTHTKKVEKEFDLVAPTKETQKLKLKKRKNLQTIESYIQRVVVVVL
mgnify:CR=1 FL=1